MHWKVGGSPVDFDFLSFVAVDFVLTVLVSALATTSVTAGFAGDFFAVVFFTVDFFTVDFFATGLLSNLTISEPFSSFTQRVERFALFRQPKNRSSNNANRSNRSFVLVISFFLARCNMLGRLFPKLTKIREKAFYFLVFLGCNWVFREVLHDWLDNPVFRSTIVPFRRFDDLDDSLERFFGVSFEHDGFFPNILRVSYQKADGSTVDKVGK
ncbi:MAG: hypothetical protein ACKOOI_14655 [Pirellula sp.]